MKIDINSSYTSPSHSTITNQTSLATHSGSATEKGSTSVAKTDNVKISDAAKLVDSFSRVTYTEATFDTQRTTEIKTEIHEGTYVINPEQIAEKLHHHSMKLQ